MCAGGIGHEHVHALALRALLVGLLLGVTLVVGASGVSLTTPPHFLWHSSREMKLLALPWQPPYQNSVHLWVPDS